MLTGALLYFAIAATFGIGTPIGLVARHCKEKKRKTQDAYDQKMAAIAARADSENTHLLHGNILVGMYGENPPAPDFAPPAGKECTNCGCWTPTTHNLCALCIDMDSDIKPEPQGYVDEGPPFPWDVTAGTVHTTMPVQHPHYRPCEGCGAPCSPRSALRPDSRPRWKWPSRRWPTAGWGLADKLFGEANKHIKEADDKFKMRTRMENDAVPDFCSNCKLHFSHKMEHRLGDKWVCESCFHSLSEWNAFARDVAERDMAKPSAPTKSFTAPTIDRDANKTYVELMRQLQDEWDRRRARSEEIERGKPTYKHGEPQVVRYDHASRLWQEYGPKPHILEDQTASTFDHLTTLAHTIWTRG